MRFQVRRHVVGTFFATLVLIAAGLALTVGSAAAGGATVSGVVTDPNGNPVVNVTVQASTTAGVVEATTTTGSEGSYSVSVSSGDTFVFTPPSGSNLGQATVANVAAPSTLNVILTVPSSSLTVTGELVDSNGNPVVGDQVQISGGPVGSSFESTTNSSGEYSMSDVPPGQYDFNIYIYSGAIELGYFYNFGNGLNLTSSSSPVNLTVPAMTSLTLQVVNSSSQPITNGAATVSASQSFYEYSAASGLVGELNVNDKSSTGTTNVGTDASGDVVLTALAGATQVTAVPNPGGATSPYGEEQESVTVGGSPTTATITLPPNPDFTLTGELVDSNGNPVVGDQVQISGGPAGSSFESTTNSSGDYSMSGIPPGQYDFNIYIYSGANELGYFYNFGNGLNLTSSSSPVNLTVPAMTLLTTRVVNSRGQPLSDGVATVSASQSFYEYSAASGLVGELNVNAKNSAGSANPPTNANGEVIFALLSNGAANVTVTPSGSGSVYTTTRVSINVTTNTSETIALTTASDGAPPPPPNPNCFTTTGYQHCGIGGVASLNSGGLTISAPSSLSWSYSLTGFDQNDADPATLEPIDASGSSSGWQVDVTSTRFTNGSSALPISALTVNGSSSADNSTSPVASCVTGSACVLPESQTEPVTYPVTVPAGASAPTAVPLFTADGTSGMGEIDLATYWWLDVPGNASSGSYSSTIQLSIITGP
jgi:hypothetical protein